ncbi:MAG: hypothetical protein HYY04_03595 [Chloroflexi bacterium]|nr:hypothetical protein [Chloroflexota bacterium]
MANSATPGIPEQGQLVEARQRRYVVAEMARSPMPLIPLWPPSPSGHATSAPSVPAAGSARCTRSAVADDRMLFVSSANLTEHAMTLNVELDLLIQGGSLPGLTPSHVDRLVELGVLRRA